MITEHALLTIADGRESEFEHAFAQARLIIEAMPGFIELFLLRGVEDESTYLLLVDWKTIEDHTVGFRQSPYYARWKELLHGFYEPFPVVQHFREIDLPVAALE